ncbi:phosphatidate cytidylyltransferase [Sneathia sanguinegens]|uniref:phosphatidate cytidylyltransferase n=1 Tax=Sneathia sanguinegens TaxID=40543 RepID=UPI0035C7282B
MTYSKSKIKRDVNIKDLGNILAGHGGFMDRFDSALFVIPFIYFYWRLYVL